MKKNLDRVLAIPTAKDLNDAIVNLQIDNRLSETRKKLPNVYKCDFTLNMIDFNTFTKIA